MPEQPAPKKQNRHVVIALNHMNKRRDDLAKKVALLELELQELDSAILALNPE